MTRTTMRAAIRTTARLAMLCLVACAFLAACSSSYTDDPNVAAIQQLRQDTAVTLPGEVNAELDGFLAKAVEDYEQGVDAQPDEAAAQVFFLATRDGVEAYIDALDRAVRNKRVEEISVDTLHQQAVAIIQRLDSVITGEPVNFAPVADAGTDQIVENEFTVQLDGSRSSDVEGDALSFRWSFQSQPPGSDPSLSDPTIVNPALLVTRGGVYEIQLIVNDGRQDSAPDSVRIEVTLPNSAPVADAGPDQTIVVGAVVTLDGTESSDIDGDPLTYSWSLTTVPIGSAAALSDATALMPTFTADAPGSYIAELIVNDGEIDSGADSVTINTRNSAPVADAGPDQSVAVGVTVTLDGSGSSDVDGDRLTYSWSLSRVPAGSAATLSATDVVQPTFMVDVRGRYEARLIVSDGTTESDPAVVEITTLNTVPVADAGDDRSAFVGEIVVLDGSDSSDADNDSLSFQWALISVPNDSKAVFVDPTAMQPAFTVDRPGMYVAQLIVNDGDLDSAPDTANITTINSPPVADAGDDQEARVGDRVRLDGRGSSDADFDDLTFRWSFTVTPAGSDVSFNNPGSNSNRPRFEPDLEGLYVAQLIVNDGSVDSDPDTVSIRVLADDDD
ncbi:MAG: hypothetical protein HKN81_03245 [Gammaproteobacteria bacterium]|nr:hypothetical protein [Gammaproteobacteria bacterium]